MEKLLKNKSMLTMGGIILIVIIWVNLIYLPGTHKIKSILSERVALEQEVASAKSLLTGVGQILQRVDQSQEQMRDKLAQISDADSIPVFIRQLTSLLNSYEIRKVKITPELPDLLDNRPTLTIGDNMLTEIEFDIDGQGRFLQLGIFLEQLQTQPCFAGVSLISLNYNRSINPDIDFALKVSAYLKRQG